MKALPIIAVGLIASVALVACDNGGGGATPTPTSATTPTPAPTLSPGTTPAPPNVCLPNPDPAPADILVIDTPQPGDAVNSPLQVSGRVAAFEAAFRITIFNAPGEPIADVVGMAQEGQTLSPFSEEVAFVTPGPKPACLWVYQESARDGSIINVGQVPILLLSP